jgi:hypothetical protein
MSVKWVVCGYDATITKNVIMYSPDLSGENWIKPTNQIGFNCIAHNGNRWVAGSGTTFI